MNVVIFLRSRDGSAGSSSGHFGIEQPIDGLGAQVGVSEDENEERRLREEEEGDY